MAGESYTLEAMLRWLVEYLFSFHSSQCRNFRSVIGTWLFFIAVVIYLWPNIVNCCALERLRYFACTAMCYLVPWLMLRFFWLPMHFFMCRLMRGIFPNNRCMAKSAESWVQFFLGIILFYLALRRTGLLNRCSNCATCSARTGNHQQQCPRHG